MGAAVAVTALVALVGATFGVALVSGLVPFINTELYLISVAAAADPRHALPLIVAATAGQMVAKTGMYLAGAGALRLPAGRARDRLESARVGAQRWSSAGAPFLFLSAFSGLPPFYVLSVAAGALRLNYPMFLVSGLAGRMARFAAVVLAPQLLKGWWG